MQHPRQPRIDAVERTADDFVRAVRADGPCTDHSVFLFLCRGVWRSDRWRNLRNLCDSHEDFLP